MKNLFAILLQITLCFTVKSLANTASTIEPDATVSTKETCTKNSCLYTNDGYGEPIGSYCVVSLSEIKEIKDGYYFIYTIVDSHKVERVLIQKSFYVVSSSDYGLLFILTPIDTAYQKISGNHEATSQINSLYEEVAKMPTCNSSTVILREKSTKEFGYWATR